jgi:hypothetical protein
MITPNLDNILNSENTETKPELKGASCELRSKVLNLWSNTAFFYIVKALCKL